MYIWSILISITRSFRDGECLALAEIYTFWGLSSYNHYLDEEFVIVICLYVVVGLLKGQ